MFFECKIICLALWALLWQSFSWSNWQAQTQGISSWQTFSADTPVWNWQRSKIKKFQCSVNFGQWQWLFFFFVENESSLMLQTKAAPIIWPNLYHSLVSAYKIKELKQNLTNPHNLTWILYRTAYINHQSKERVPVQIPNEDHFRWRCTKARKKSLA